MIFPTRSTSGGETETFNATLTAAVDANYTIAASTGAVEVSGEALRAGGFRGSVTGVEAGEVEVTVTASQPSSPTVTSAGAAIGYPPAVVGHFASGGVCLPREHGHRNRSNRAPQSRVEPVGDGCGSS